VVEALLMFSLCVADVSGAEVPVIVRDSAPPSVNGRKKKPAELVPLAIVTCELGRAAVHAASLKNPSVPTVLDNATAVLLVTFVSTLLAF
jgi:hypothetical protein